MKDKRQLPSLLLVALQFGLLFLLAAWAATPVLAGAIPLAAWLAAALSLALGVWTFSANRPGNFNIRPIPKRGGALITSGPYRWIRHPMYTSFLLGTWALADTAASDEAWLVWWMLTLVLWVKSQFEERWMLETHPGYAAYRLQTRRYIPWLY
jgi:protein-S-isoprenylcysteine O-methyltransferase Ste14